MLDAPVSGSIPQAESGTPAIMVGGDEQAFADVQPLHVPRGTIHTFRNVTTDAARLLSGFVPGFERFLWDLGHSVRLEEVEPLPVQEAEIELLSLSVLNASQFLKIEATTFRLTGIEATVRSGQGCASLAWHVGAVRKGLEAPAMQTRAPSRSSTR